MSWDHTAGRVVELFQQALHKSRSQISCFHLPTRSALQQAIIEWWECTPVRLGSSCKVDPPEPHSHVDKAYYRAEAWWGPSEALSSGVSPWLSSACAPRFSHLTSETCWNGSLGSERPSVLVTWTPSLTPVGTSGLIELKIMIPMPLRWVED